MPRDWNLMKEFERADAARLEEALTPDKALRLFEAMWERARQSGALHRADPLEGLEALIAVVRTINSLKDAPRV